MKLRLPSFLCTALLACMAALPSAYAATFTTKGVDVTGFSYSYDANAYVATFADSTNRFYDGGKGTYWDGYNSVVRAGAKELFEANDNSFSFLGDLQTRIPASSSGSCTASSFQNLTDDGGQCWAYTSSNVLQYWQTYYGVFAKKARTESSLVHGYAYDKAHLDKLGGTQSLKLNMQFYDNWVNDGGDSQTALAWYLGGKVFATSRMREGYAEAGYFADYFTYTGKNNATGNDYSSCYYADTSLAKFSTDVKTLFGQDDGTKGQIVHLDLTSSTLSGHAITCYGYETDAEGNIIAVYVTNSDDQDYALLKLNVKWEQMTLSNGRTVTGAVLYNGAYKWTYAGKDWRITSMNAIDTPEVLKNMLAEYESGNLTWMGNLESWTNTAAVEEDVNVLPTDETGWMTYAGKGTDHAGYYNSYYTPGRGVEFNDEATKSTISVAEDISVASMAVNNTKLDYSFNGGDSTKTITMDGAFTKTGTGALEFNNVKLVAASANLSGDVTFDQLNISGGVTANGHTVTIKRDSSIGSIDSQGEDKAGTSTLRLMSGTTTLTGGVWSNLKNLELTEGSKLVSNGSVSVAGSISTLTLEKDASTTAKTDLEAKYCIKVGQKDVANTGNVTLTGDMKAGAYIEIHGNATIGGTVTTSDTLTVGGSLVMGGGNVGRLVSDNVTLKGDTSVWNINTGSDSYSLAGTAALTVAGGQTTVRTHNEWMELKSLALSDQGKLKLTASVAIADSITTAQAAGTLPSGTQAGLEAGYCIIVGSKDKAGSGNVEMAGNLASNHAYIHVNGNAKVGGNISAAQEAEFGGNLTMAANKTLTAQSLEVKGALGLNDKAPAGSKASLTATNNMLLGGNVSNVSLEARDIVIGTAGGSTVTMDTVDIKLTGGSLTLNEAVVTGDCNFTSTGTTPFNLNATNVTFVLDDSNSFKEALEPQTFTMMLLSESAQAESPSKTLVINSGMLKNLNVNGSVTLDLSHYAQTIKDGGYDNVTLAFANDMSYAPTSTVQATLNGTNFVAADSTADNLASFSVSKLSGDAVPEPTTATLSLLALAALAARRRRK